MPVMDAEQRKKLADALLRKAEGLVREMREGSEAGDPNRVDGLADRFQEVVKTSGFPPQRATEFRDAVKSMQLSVRQLATESLLSKAELAARQGDEKTRNDLLNKAKEHFGKALRHGADDDFRAAVEKRVQAVLLTTKEGVGDRTKAAAKRKLEARDTRAKAPNGRERRRAIRYNSPTLVILVEGVRYTTSNWSTRGLLVEPYRGELGVREGDRVRVDIGSAEVEAAGRTIASVVRVDLERGTLALTFADISTIILAIMHEMKNKGIIPEPE